MANWWDSLGTTIGDNLIGMQMPFGMAPPTDPQQRAAMINPMLLNIGATMLAGRGRNPAVNLGQGLINAQQSSMDMLGKSLYAKQIMQADEERKAERERANRTRSWAAQQPWAKNYPIDEMDPKDIFSLAVNANKPRDVPAAYETFQLAQSDPAFAQFLKQGDRRRTQIDEVNGRKLLVDMDTGETIADLGMAPSRQQSAPQGYRFAADGTTLEAIPGGPATKMPAEVAGRVAMLDTAMKEMPKAEEFFLNSGTSFGNEAMGWAFNAGEYGRAKRTVRMAIEAGLRAMTGAAAPESEVQTYENMFLPTPVDTKETRKQKLGALRDFMGQAKSIMEQGRGQTRSIQMEPPPDVDPALWQAMTPEEQALWRTSQ